MYDNPNPFDPEAAPESIDVLARLLALAVTVGACVVASVVFAAYLLFAGHVGPAPGTVAGPVTGHTPASTSPSAGRTSTGEPATAARSP